jgi:hypothetical protein
MLFEPSPLPLLTISPIHQTTTISTTLLKDFNQKEIILFTKRLMSDKKTLNGEKERPAHPHPPSSNSLCFSLPFRNFSSKLFRSKEFLCQVSISLSSSLLLISSHLPPRTSEKKFNSLPHKNQLSV